MAGPSTIEWTKKTWNPVRGCIKVSPGCKHCYAETFAERWRGIAGHPYEQGFDPRTAPDQLDAPLHWRAPTTVFVNSMSDLFGEFAPVPYIASIFAVMAAGFQHTYQVLTKRGAWMEEVMGWLGAHDMEMVREKGDEIAARMGWCHANEDTWRWPLPNVHLGVSVEDRRYGLPRIDHLRRCPAAVRFLSIEPLLEDLGEIDLTGINWVIVGGESGHGARPMHPDWARSIRDQCGAAGVPFFFKQWGHWRDGVAPVGKKRAGRLLDGRTWDERPASAAVQSATARRSLPIVEASS